MNSPEMDRRDFHQLALAALGGVMAGTSIGCNNGAAPPAAAPKSSAPAAMPNTGPQVTLSATAEELILDDPHVCRGLNSCKQKGRDKENACAGQGTCASIADAACSQQNECKGQGGCGANPGMNDCKGQGGCHVPLMDSAWKTARAAFESAMAKNDRTFGAAPAKKK